MTDDDDEVRRAVDRVKRAFPGTREATETERAFLHIARWNDACDEAAEHDASYRRARDWIRTRRRARQPTRSLEAPQTMGWARFDDNYTTHPKVVAAGPWAELLDMRSIIYCARYDTDGLITPASLKAISRSIPRVHEKVDALVRAGRWSTNPGGGWIVHDFLDTNLSKAQREDYRAAGRRRAAASFARKNAKNAGGSSRGEVEGSLGVGGPGGGDAGFDAPPLSIEEQQRRIRDLGEQLRQRRKDS